MRVLVVGNGELPAAAVVDRWLAWADRVVAADGGANHLLRRGVQPDHVVGDMDSLLGSTRRRLGARRLRRDGNPHQTDLEKCLEFAKRQGATSVVLTGVSPGRLDHVLGHVALLVAWSTQFKVRLVDPDFETSVVGRRATFRAPLGTVISLHALQTVRDVRTKGLRWNLEGQTLEPGPRGVHNFVVSNPVQIAVGQGRLLLMRGLWQEPHSDH